MKFEDMINTITLGNCYELIKEIPDNSIDLIYIDIPYLFTHGKGGAGALSKRVNRLMKEELYKIKDGIDISLFDEICRILKNINIYIWCNQKQMLEILKYFIDNKNCNFEILTWNKTNPIPMTDNTYLSDIEYCLFFREKGVRLNNGYELKSKYYISPLNKADKDKYNHPTIKPLELVKRHILHSTQKGDLVLDCFSGSGTTCVACKELDRRFIGIEIDPEYHKISLDRLNGILANGQISFDTDISKL